MTDPDKAARQLEEITHMTIGEIAIIVAEAQAEVASRQMSANPALRRPLRYIG